LVEEEEEEGMDTSGPGINGKWVAGFGREYVVTEMCLVHKLPTNCHSILVLSLYSLPCSELLSLFELIFEKSVGRFDLF
jgi:hypothetical protein